jgi:hypothetical protein
MTAWYEIAPDEEMPAGKVTDFDPTPAHMRIRIRAGHMSETLRHDLNDYHVRVLAGWAPRWGTCDERGPGGDRGIRIFEVLFKLVPASHLPEGEICTPVLDRSAGVFVIFVSEEGDHLSPQAVAEINEYIKVIVAGGLWIQAKEWGDPEGPPQ